MKFQNLKECAQFLETQGELLRIDHPVAPDLEMAEITRRVFDAKGPALLFTRVKNSPFPAVSNLFGTFERSLKIFEPQLEQVKCLVELLSRPKAALRSPGKIVKALPALFHSLPVRSFGSPAVTARTCAIGDLPMIRCWPEDGGAFVLLPQVFSKDPSAPSLLTSNLGMYRVQISGNDYNPGKEVGLHYQLHRGIGNHHKKAIEHNSPLAVTIFIGGPPAHTLAAVMPLPEGLPEICFAGALAGRNFRYAHVNDNLLASDADFCITGVVVPGKTKKEGPFGDHLGYYSLAHDYPFVKVTRVYHRKNAVFPFTVVGRPPQEDSQFGKLIHDITRPAVMQAIPGVTAVNAVDDAGVHPLLLAKGHERYLPYEERIPRELLTHAHRILGTGQLSLAKYLLICAHEDAPDLDVNDEPAFFAHLLERLDLRRDLHFSTQTTMDTLDYSTQQINAGSKLVMAAAGPPRRQLASQFPSGFFVLAPFDNACIAVPGIVVVNGPAFEDYDKAQHQIRKLTDELQTVRGMDELPLVVVVDDARFASACFANFLWVTFLRSNPSHDVYGINQRVRFKHWQCDPPLIIDARMKPFHTGVLAVDRATKQRVDRLGLKGGPLYGII